MALLRYLQPKGGLTDPKGSLSLSLPSSVIAAANHEVSKATSTARKKRGPYDRYTPEEHFNIGLYTCKHGITAAARYFSRRFQRKVCNSTLQSMKEDYTSSLRQKREVSQYEGDLSLLHNTTLTLAL